MSKRATLFGGVDGRQWGTAIREGTKGGLDKMLGSVQGLKWLGLGWAVGIVEA